MHENVILVDDSGKEIGIADKWQIHTASTPLHLAFSCYIFNKEGKLLVTKRASHKKVWPGVWTNSVCGHPAPDESMIDAIKRRLNFELGMSAKDFKVVLPDYRYKTPPFNGIVENEVCPVYTAITQDEPKPNKEEVDDFIWVNWENFTKSALTDNSDEYSWWCKDQIKQFESKNIKLN